MRGNLRGGLWLAAVVLVSACSSTEPPSSARLVVRLADGPGNQVESAIVWISGVYLVPGTDPAGGHLVVASFAPAQDYELTDLQNGVTALVGETTIPEGDYSQLRMVVDSARVTLKAPLTFSDGSSSVVLKTPSAQQTGIKVNFDAPVRVAPGVTVLVVDFDVGRNFVFNGPATAPHGMLFKPVLHATTMDIASTIGGTLGPDAARAAATVYAIIPVGADPLATDSDTVSTASVNATTGAYTLLYLDPRVSLTTPFTILATSTGYTPQAQSVAMPDGNVAHNVPNVDFTLAPAP